jgi:hypothetical protein
LEGIFEHRVCKGIRANMWVFFLFSRSVIVSPPT